MSSYFYGKVVVAMTGSGSVMVGETVRVVASEERNVEAMNFVGGGGGDRTGRSPTSGGRSFGRPARRRCQLRASRS